MTLFRDIMDSGSFYLFQQRSHSNGYSCHLRSTLNYWLTKLIFLNIPNNIFVKINYIVIVLLIDFLYCWNRLFKRACILNKPDCVEMEIELSNYRTNELLAYLSQVFHDQWWCVFFVNFVIL